jgi:hypothetical protein
MEVPCSGSQDLVETLPARSCSSTASRGEFGSDEGDDGETLFISLWWENQKSEVGKGRLS